jgi:hypothetical protein
MVLAVELVRVLPDLGMIGLKTMCCSPETAMRI